MEAQELMSRSVELMLLGMGTVFTFLCLLVVCTLLMSRILAHLAPEAPRESSPASAAPGAPGTPDAPLRAAIIAAIHAHRQKH